MMKSGARYDDVRTQPLGESHRIQFKDGTVSVVPNNQIRSLRPAATTWTVPVRPNIPEPAEPRTEPEPAVRETHAKVEPNQTFTPANLNWGTITRSAVLPGWGQFDEGRKASGALYAAGYLMALQRYWTLRGRHAAAQAEYNDPIPVGSVASQTLNGTMTVVQAAAVNWAYLGTIERRVYRLQKQGNEMVLILSFVWGWNMLDIVKGGVPWERRWFGGDSGSSTFLRIRMEKNSISASVSVHL